MDKLSMIIDFESGELSAEKTLELFAELIKDGTAWTLQGCYGRLATQLIDNGYLSRQGEILKQLET